MAVGIDAVKLHDDLAAEREVGRGPLIETLSPFGVVVHSLLHRQPEAMAAVLEGKRKSKGVVIHSEVVVPTAFDRSRWKNAILVDGGA